MDNPFIENGFLLPVASVNKLKISKINNVNDKNIINKYASEIFSSDLLNTSVRAFLLSHKVSFTEDDMFNIFKQCLSGGSSGQTKAGERPHDSAFTFVNGASALGGRELLKRLGKNLACILLALYEGLDENKALRDDWDHRHWDYWHSVKKVILCGGFMRDIIGEMIVEYAKEFLNEIGKRPYEISTAEDNLPLIGTCKYGSVRSENSIAFDFGHSYIKRCYYRNNNGEVSIKMLKPEKSRHLELDEDPCLLFDYIFEVIIKTLGELPSGFVQGPIIPSCIANYINNGDIYEKRGNYSKLKKLEVNFQKYLSLRLREKLGANIEVEFLHDGSAAAYAVNEERCAVLTLGTAIGVGFTQKNFNFNYKIL